MSTDTTTDTTTDDTDTEETESTDTTDTDTTESDTWTPPDKATFDKLVEKAKTRDAKLREAQAKIRELSQPADTKDTEPDPVAVANTRLVRAEARSVLAGVGVTDKKDQAAVLEVLNLDGIEVDDEGEVDTDALESRVTELRRIFGGPEPVKRKVSGRVDTRDRAGSSTNSADPDANRYRAFLGSGR